MMRFVSFLTLVLSLSFLGCQKEQHIQIPSFEKSVFKRVEVIENAQLDASLLPKIASASDSEIMDQLISKLFKPIKGEATVYIFRSEYLGRYKEWSDEEIFHDILAVEVGLDGEVIEAFIYPENCAEMPSFAFLFQMTKGDLAFKDVQRISDFSFQRPLVESDDTIAGSSREIHRNH